MGTAAIITKKTFLLFFLLIIFIAVIWWLFFFSSWREKEQIIKLSSGVYIVDLQKLDSSFTDTEKTYYKGIKLELHENGDFNFSRSVPINEVTNGRWELAGENIEKKITLHYSNGYVTHTSYCYKPDCVLDIQIPIYDQSMPSGTKRIYFVR